MSLKLGLGLGVNSGNGVPSDYALEFNGSDEYLQIALPNNELLASAGTADFYSSGSAIAGWIAGDDVVWNGTETGKTYTNTITIPADNTLSKTISGLIVGKKYKLKLRYQAASIDGFTIGSNDGTYFTLMQSSGEWNTVSKIFIALDTTIIFIAPASGDVILDYASVKCDQGFDLNKDQEMILHSKNWDFEGSTTDWAGTGNHSVSLSTLDKSGTGATNTQSLLISASGAGSSGSNYVSLPSANLESCVAGKKYTLEGFARLDPASLTYGSELFTEFTAGVINPYETLTVSGNDITSAINTTGNGSVYVNSFATVAIGEIYKVTFNFTLNSGTAPALTLAEDANTISGGRSGNYTPVNGANTIYVVVTLAQTNADLILWNSSASNWALTDFSVVKASAIPTITAQLGTKSVTNSALSIVAGTFTKFALNFEATASEVNQDLKLWLSGAGNVYVDKISLTQKYDRVIIKKFKPNLVATQTLLSFDGVNYIELRDNGKIRFQIGDDSNVIAYDNSQVLYSANEWTNLICLFNSTDKLYTIKNGVSPVGVSVITVGKDITRLGFQVGLAIGSAIEKFAGQISHIQIIRFENISQSTFNSALTGLQYPTGGGAEEVLRVTFQDGSSIVNCLKDYSPKAHTVSGTNVDITNRKRVVR